MSFWHNSDWGEDRYVLLLDMGTTTAKAAVACVDCSQARLVMLGSARRAVPTGTYGGGLIADVQTLERVVFDVSQAAIRAAGMMPQEICLGFSGGVVKSQNVSVEVERHQPEEKVSKEELETLMRISYERALAQINYILDAQLRKTGWRFTDLRAVDFILDGYHILNPQGYKGRDLKVNLNVEFVALPHFELIAALTKTINPQMRSRIAYGPGAVLRGLASRDLFGFNAIMIDVGGSLTDVMVVKAGNVLQQDFFVLGGHDFTKQAAKTLGKDETEAEFWKLQTCQTDDTPDSHLYSACSQALGRVAELWLDGVAFALEEFSFREVLPNLVLLYGGGGELPIMTEILHRLQDRDKLHFGGTLQVKRLGLEDIRPVEALGELRAAEDLTMFSLAESFFEDKESNAPNVFLRKIMYSSQK